MALEENKVSLILSKVLADAFLSISNNLSNVVMDASQRPQFLLF